MAITEQVESSTSSSIPPKRRKRQIRFTEFLHIRLYRTGHGDFMVRIPTAIIQALKWTPGTYIGLEIIVFENIFGEEVPALVLYNANHIIERLKKEAEEQQFQNQSQENKS